MSINVYIYIKYTRRKVKYSFVCVWCLLYYWMTTHLKNTYLLHKKRKFLISSIFLSHIGWLYLFGAVKPNQSIKSAQSSYNYDTTFDERSQGKTSIVLTWKLYSAVRERTQILTTSSSLYTQRDIYHFLPQLYDQRVLINALLSILFIRTYIMYITLHFPAFCTSG